MIGETDLEMDPAAELEVELMQFVKPIDEATERGDSDVQRFYQDAVLFLTGGTGFIGKQLIEKLFRSCDIKKAFVLIRSKRGRSTKERVQDMLSDPVFEPVLKKKPDLASKIVGVEGDLSSIQLGISNDDWSTIVEEVEIIFHVAATVRFDENLRTAAITNVRGTRETLALGRACKKLRSFVHVSTAYCHATADRTGKEVREQFYTSPMLAEDLLSLVDSFDGKKLDNVTQSVIRGWPNTYTFTKAIAEELVRGESGNLPICIVRPTIVVQAYREPLVGWMDLSCLYGPNGMFLGAGTGVVRVVFVNNTLKLSYVPVDYVNNSIIAAGWNTGVRALQEPLIYTVSSTRIGLTFKHVTKPLRSPGRSLITPAAIWYCYLIETNNRLFYWFLSWILHYIPAYIVDTVINVFKIKMPKGLKSFVHLYTKFDKLSSVYTYFLTHEWDFDDSNLQSLWQKLSKTDRTIYNFNVDSIDSIDFIIRGIIGGRKYIIKDGLKGTKAAAARQKWFQLANFVIFVGYLAVLWLVLSWMWWFVRMMV